MSMTFRVYIDLLEDGFDMMDDFTEYVKNISGIIGYGSSDNMKRAADAGRCTIVLSNVSRIFSAGERAGLYFTVGVPVRVEVIDGLNIYPVFTGRLNRVSVAPGIHGSRETTIECGDILESLQQFYISLPLQYEKRGNEMLKLIGSAAFKTANARADLKFTGTLPSDGNTVTINGVVFTFKTVLDAPTPNQVLIASSVEAQIDNLCAAINGDNGVGTLYTTGTSRPQNVSALPKLDYYRMILRDRPINYYRLGESSGIVANDSGTSGAGGEGLVSNITWGAATDLGDNNTAASFNGTNSVIFLPNIDFKNKSFSIEMWIKPDASSPPATQYMFQSVDSAVTGKWLRLALVHESGSLGHVNMLFYGDDLTGSTGSIDYGLWNHVIFEYRHDATDGKSARIFVNGVLDAEGDHGAFLGDSYLTTIGLGEATYFKGVIDEFAIYQYALTAEQALYHYQVVATVPGIDLRATLRGEWGNSIPLLESSSGILAYDFGGGVDGPESFDYETGLRIMDVAGEAWKSDKTTALAAMRDVCDTEQGWLWADGDGTLVWKNGDWQFRQAAVSPKLHIEDVPGFTEMLDSSQIANRVTVSFTPPYTTVAGVIAKAKSPIKILGLWGDERNNPVEPSNEVVNTFTSADNYNTGFDSLKSVVPDTRKKIIKKKTSGGVVVIDPIVDQGPGPSVNTEVSRPIIFPGGGKTVIKIPFVDLATGKLIAAKSLTLPLVPGTNFTVSDKEGDTGGWDYTYDGLVTFTLAANATDVEVSLKNTALGPLYVRNLEIEGVGYVAYDAQQIVFDNTASQDLLGRRSLDIKLPIMAQNAQNYAASLAAYYLERRSTERFSIASIDCGAINYLNGVNLFSLDIGDVVEISETQTGIFRQKHLITGIKFTLQPGGNVSTRLSFNLYRLDNTTYGMLDDTTYGILDTNTRMAV